MKISDCKVELIDSMGTDISVVNAARVSFNKRSYYMYDAVQRSSVEYMSEKDMKLLKYLAEHNHHTPFGHCFLSFRIKAPIFIARQLGKHQVGLCWNEVSRRYVNEEPEFFFPKEWRRKADNVKQGSSNASYKEVLVSVDQDLNYDAESICALTLFWYQHNISMGLCPEQARMILPQNMMTEWIWSGSLLAFIRVCNLRLDSHTQKETQDVAKEIAYHLDMRFPNSWRVCKKYIENI